MAPILAALVITTCRKQDDTPEACVRALLARAEEAAEARQLRAFRDILARDYRDEQGRNRDDVLNILRYWFLRHQAIHLLVVVREIAFEENGDARVVALVGMAGRPPGGLRSLLEMGADIYHIEARLRPKADGSFEAIAAAWRPADLEDVTSADGEAGWEKGD